MSQNTAKSAVTPPPRPIRIASPAPAVPKPSSGRAIEEGTKLTLQFLALESFANRFGDLTFVTTCISNLGERLNALLGNDPSLHHEIRNFLSGLPLDAISQSSHPKRIKQLMIESLLSPKSLTQSVLTTDPQDRPGATLAEIRRDLLNYTRLCEHCSDPLAARTALARVLKNGLALNDSDWNNLLHGISSLKFKYLTDSTFCINFRSNGGATQSLTSQPAKPLRVAPVIPSTPATDLPLKSVLLFQRYESLVSPIVSGGGETYESIQRRVQDQQNQLERFKLECQELTFSVREAIYNHVKSSWHRFVRNDSVRLDRQTRFLDFISNPA